MKNLVVPTAPHCYIDPNTGNEIQPFRPSVVTHSVYIASLIGSGKIELLSADLSEEATDEEFAKFFADSDRNLSLSVESFLAKFSKGANLEHLEQEEAPVVVPESEVKEDPVVVPEVEVKAVAAPVKAKAAKKD